MALTEKYPGQIVIDGSSYVFEKVLKEDFFSVNVLYQGKGESRYVLKLSDFRFLFGLLLRPFAVLMSRHEYRIYRRVENIDGIPALGPRFGWRGFFHEYIEGSTLAQWDSSDPLPDDFFDRLGLIIRQCHARGIFYADLNKLGNIIAGQDGKPWLIDFQICLHFSSAGSSDKIASRVFRALIKEDIYHLYKHKRRFQPQRLSEEEEKLAQRSQLGQGFNRWFGRPFRRIKRTLYPAGSNETIWYKWRKR